MEALIDVLALNSEENQQTFIPRLLLCIVCCIQVCLPLSQLADSSSFCFYSFDNSFSLSLSVIGRHTLPLLLWKQLFLIPAPNRLLCICVLTAFVCCSLHCVQRPYLRPLYTVVGCLHRLNCFIFFFHSMGFSRFSKHPNNDFLGF